MSKRVWATLVVATTVALTALLGGVASALPAMTYN